MGLLQTSPREQQRAAGQAAGHGGGGHTHMGVPVAMPSPPGVGASTAVHFPPKPTPLSDLKQSLIPQLSTFNLVA